MKTSFPHLAADAYRQYENLLDRSRPLLLLGVRLIWGFQFAQTGWGKWQDIPRVTGFFTEIGIPLPAFNAHMVATTELAGGIFLILGLFSRLTPVPLIIAMGVAYLTTEQEALRALATGNLDPVLTAAPFLFLLASVLVLVFGPGSLSVDHLLAKIPALQKLRRGQESGCTEK